MPIAFLAPISITTVHMHSSVSCYLCISQPCRFVSYLTEKVSLALFLWLSQLECRQAALQRSRDEECDNKEVEEKGVLVHTYTQTHTVVVMASTALAPPYCKQGGGDRLPVLVNIISVIQQTRHWQHLAVPRHNQH